MTCHASGTARAVTAAGTAWPRVVGACLDQLEPLPAGANLGIAYFGEQLAPVADAVLAALRARTGVRHWLGAGGLAVLNGAQGTATGGLSVLVAALPEAGFRIAPTLTSPIAERALVLVHAALDEGDPRALLAEIAGNAPAGVVGGLTAASRAPVHLAGAAAAGSAVSLGLHRELPAVAGLARAGTPLGPPHRVTSALGSTILTLDGRPALEVMAEELGELFRHGGSRAARQLWLADGVASDAAVPWRVRRVSAADGGSGSLRVEGGRVDGPVRLMRPDPAGSLARIGALARDLRGRLDGRQVACGLYLTSRFRSPGLFGPGVNELAVLRAELGAVPLIGLVTDAELFAGSLHEGAGILLLLGSDA